MSLAFASKSQVALHGLFCAFFWQCITNGSLFVYRSLSSGSIHFPPSSDCRSLNQVSLKEPNAVALLDDFGLLQPYADDDCQEAVYTLCPRVDDGVHCIPQSHAARFYPTINHACQYTMHHKKQAVRELHCIT
jgi:hypothetical protein